ncbi:unnamed protein product [Closterium sp. Yama58-4]|nr:unnamed protein product [Closterium sp. Yama58-4]
MAEPAGVNITSSRQLCPDIQLSYPNAVQECYASRSTTGYSVYVIPFNTSCDSFLLLPAEQLWSPAVRSAWYLAGMLYCFVGLAAIVRVFMAALDRISSTYAMVSRRDPETGREERRMEKVWNSTVVNIALMALGTSAPEIVIAVVDALKHLNQGPGVLGAGTVLGSAAFNLMVISAVCVVTPPAHSIKRIQAVGVFLLELAASTWAYIWILLVLKVISPGRVTILEACITLLFFPLFILLAYAQDQHWQHLQQWGMPLPFLPRPTPRAPRRGSLTRFKNWGSREALIGSSAAHGASMPAAAGGSAFEVGAWWRALWGGYGSTAVGAAGGRGGEGVGKSSNDGSGAVLGAQGEVEMQRGAEVASMSIAVGGVEEGAGERQAVEGVEQRSHGSSDLSDWEDVGRMEHEQQQQQQQHEEASDNISVEPAAAEEGRVEAGRRSVSLNAPPAAPQRSSSSNLRRRSAAGISAAAAMQHDSPDPSLSRRLGQHLWLRSQLPGLTHSPAPAVRATPLASPAPLILEPLQQQQLRQQQLQQEEERWEEEEKAEGHARGGRAAGHGRVGLVAADDGRAVDLLQEQWTLLVRSGEREVCRYEHTPASTSGASSSAASCVTSPVQALTFQVATAEAQHLQLVLTAPHCSHFLSNSSCTHARQLSTSNPHATSPSLQSSSPASADAGNASAAVTDRSLQSQSPWFTAVALLEPLLEQSHTAYTCSLLFENASGAGRSRGCGAEGCCVEGEVRAELHVGVRIEAGEGIKLVEVTVTVLSLRFALQKQHGNLGLGGLSTCREPTSSALSSSLGLGEAWLQQIEKAISVCRPTQLCHHFTESIFYLTACLAFGISQVPLPGHERDVSLLGLGIHFVSFYWKLLFSLIPPPSLMRGWPAFILCLCFMAGISFLIEEFARLFACTSGLHLFSVAIVFVASGTSVPDLLASRTAARLSPSADVAIANIMGSNAVNVFVGFGLAWLIKAGYEKAVSGDSLFVPDVLNLEVSVIAFLCTTVVFVIIMGLRRNLTGGELGGARGWACCDVSALLRIAT